MKNLLLVSLFALGLSLGGSANASLTGYELELQSNYLSMGFFPMGAEAFVSPWQVQVRIYNNYARPLACEGWVQATDARGYVSYSQFQMAPMFPGTFGFAYVNAVYGVPFVGAWANAYCQVY